MKGNLLIGLVMAGALLAGAAAIGMGHAENYTQRSEVVVFGYHGLVVMWLGVAASLVYFYVNRDR